MPKVPAALRGLKPGDTLVFWPTTPEWTKEYPERWKIGGELTLDAVSESTPRPCKATWKDGGGTAWLLWCDVALPGTTGDTSWKSKEVTVCGMDGTTLGTYEMPGSTVGELCAKLAKELSVPNKFLVELSFQDKKLAPELSLQVQGVPDGATLTLVKVEGKSVAGCHTFDLKSYPEDRYSEWQEVQLNEDGSCSHAEVTAGTGRLSAVSTTDRKIKKHGTWAVSSRTKTKVVVVISWDDGKSETKTIDI
ncbi:unnamed protein product [Symbiodinium natans]|uniref:Ubiquitin-like domain-containing protein n=1 Tax=Symbiodinium natans TaxID=878477 RepID=A0A812HGI9_9DINO|nr:unnamed protein product [Symbiodinium natans]